MTSRATTRRRRTIATAALAASALVAVACGGSDAPATSAAGAEVEQARAAGSGTDLTGELRLGYLPNVTHAPAIVGVEEGLFADALGDGVELSTQTFNAGPDVIQALLSGALDASYIGPNPAINGYAQSGGEALRIVAGTTSGGAYLVTRPDVTSPDDLVGTTLATPQLGNTQDVALRAWLLENGHETTLEGAGDVAIAPLANAEALEAFREGQIDGAWVPEPWATRLIEEAGGKVLIDERELWEGGEFVTTHLIVATAFLESSPDLVQALLEGHLAALDRVEEDPEAAQEVVAASIETITGTALDADSLRSAWQNLTFTADPIAPSLYGSAEDAQAAGLLDPVDLDGIYELDPLNRLLTARGDDEVSS